MAWNGDIIAVYKFDGNFSESRAGTYPLIDNGGVFLGWTQGPPDPKNANYRGASSYANGFKIPYAIIELIKPLDTFSWEFWINCHSHVGAPGTLIFSAPGLGNFHLGFDFQNNGRFFWNIVPGNADNNIIGTASDLEDKWVLIKYQYDKYKTILKDTNGDPVNIVFSAYSPDTNAVYNLENINLSVNIFDAITADLGFPATLNYQQEVSFNNMIFRENITNDRKKFTFEKPIFDPINSGLEALIPLSGKTGVRIQGGYFSPDITVDIDGTPVTDLIIYNTTVLTFTAPPNTDGIKTVTITNPGDGSATHAITYSAIAILLIDNTDITGPTFSPTIGGVGLTITGWGFASTNNDTKIYIGTALADNIVSITDTEIKLITPALDAGAYDITVDNSETHGNTRAAAINYYEFLISPPAGGIAGGTNITILGYHLSEYDNILIDGAPCTDLLAAPGTPTNPLHAKTPAHAAAIGMPVYILYGGARAAFFIGFFEYSDSPYIDAAGVFEKNRQASTGAWLTLLEITVPGNSTPILLARNNQNITWDGRAWRAFPFNLGDITGNSNNEIPNLQIQISNTTREIQAILEATDGAAGVKIEVILIHTTHAEAIWRGTYAVLYAACDQDWATFTCGLEYPTTARRPIEAYQKYICRFIYGDIKCNIADATKTIYPTCSKTISDCKTRGNQARFGGELNIPGYYFG